MTSGSVSANERDFNNLRHVKQDDNIYNDQASHSIRFNVIFNIINELHATIF